ncbi:MAG: leucine-rich repeat domain-containing protein, partial [Bacteroidota bacterium]
MTNQRPVFFILLLLISIVSGAQEMDLGISKNKGDSLKEARRKDYEKRVAHMKEMERRMRRDLKGFRDSVALVRKEKTRKEARIRIEEYKSDPNFSELKEIDLSGAQLEEVPAFVLGAISMEVLVLDGNNISRLPKELSELKQLKRIYWRNNDLGTKKVQIPKLIGIEKLDLTGNSLSKLPKVQRIKGIEELVLESNQFEKIPFWKVRKLKSIKELELSQNPIALDKRWYWLLKDLKILKLNKCGITA